MDMIVANWRDVMQDYAGSHPAEDVRSDRIQKGRCILLSEGVLGWPLMRRCGVIWHEFGHAYNEAASRPNTEQNAYLFEVDMIDYACTTNVFQVNGISTQQVSDYLDWRQPQFNKGKTAELDQKLADLRAKLGAMSRHGFMH